MYFKSITFLIFLLHISKIAVSQADLTVTSSSLSALSTNINQPVTVTVLIKNNGNTAAGISTLFFYLSTNTTFNEVIGKVSVPVLQSLSTHTASFIYTPKQSITPSNYYIGMKVDGNNTITESNENNVFHVSQQLQIASTISLSQKLPYPIIFIHGLSSNSATWDNTISEWMALWGVSNGGRMDFCLNADQNVFTSNITTDYIDFTENNSEANLQAADCYFINFDVDYLGNYDADDYTVQSNQAAIYKQGRAVADAIKHVLNVTGREKVVIMGHSMGGLATRTYLQDQAMWQPDNSHHIAKLYTLGTPHGGSNSTAGWLNALAGIDGNSEACRDLRYPSSILSFPGKFLFGGQESLQNNGNVNNDDINCNGVIGDLVTALNGTVTALPLDVNYTCLIGAGALSGGDGIVDETRANLNNYGLNTLQGSYLADTLIDDSFAFVESHTSLPGYAEVNVKGIDEPNSYNVNNYAIDTANWYMGFVNQQSKMNSVTKDYDYYQFKNTNMASVNLSLSNNFHEDLSMKLINMTTSGTVTINANGRSNIDTTVFIGLSDYVLRIEGNPKTESWKYPYYYKINPKTYLGITTGISVNEEEYLFKLFPNPSSGDFVECHINSTTTEPVIVRITNMTGQILQEKEIDIIQGNNSFQISTTDLNAGIYNCSVLFKNNFSLRQQLIIIK